MRFSESHKQAADVIIIGGGIIGLSIARELRKNNFGRVVILEKNRVCGAEASGAAAGMLAPQAEADQNDNFFRLCWESRDLYPKFAAELLEETGVDVELDRTGTLYLAFSERDSIELEHRFAWQAAADLPVEKLAPKEVLKLEPNVSPAVSGALRFPLDWQVENRKIIAALNKFSPAEIANAAAESLIFANGKVSGVKTDAGVFSAPKIVIASGAWSSLIDFPFDFNSSVEPIRGQMLCFAGDEKQFRHVIYSPRGYVVPRLDNRILVGATVENAGFDKRTTNAGAALLRQTAFEISSEFQNLKLIETWSGLRPKSLDGLPILGEFPANSDLYFATGHYRNGILLAPLTARLIADKIAKNIDSPFLEIFNPSRFQN